MLLPGFSVDVTRLRRRQEVGQDLTHRDRRNGRAHRPGIIAA